LIFENSIVAGSYGIVRFDMTTGSALGSQKGDLNLQFHLIFRDY
jgi:hypothetical protein